MGRTELGFHHGSSPPPYGCTPQGLLTPTGAPRAYTATTTTAWLCMVTENVTQSPSTVMATSWLPTILPTMLLAMAPTIMDTARGPQRITSVLRGQSAPRPQSVPRDQRTGIALGTITTGDKGVNKT